MESNPIPDMARLPLTPSKITSLETSCCQEDGADLYTISFKAKISAGQQAYFKGTPDNSPPQRQAKAPGTNEVL